MSGQSVMHIGMVAGEASGDRLGAALIPHLRKHFPGLQMSGVGGPRMQAQGFETRYDMDRLSVMGFVEPLQRLPELLRMRRDLVAYFRASKVNLFLGIDSPDFNLGIARRLHDCGIPTAHYVSPSVWAWRQGRVRGIRRSLDLMLTLFPFEARFYQDQDVPVRFVGHPLADEIPTPPDRTTCRLQLGLDLQRPILALMPGSRMGEIEQMLPLFLEVISILQSIRPELLFVIPAANDRVHERIAAATAQMPQVVVTREQARQAIGSSDAVLVASGTSTLEVMLQVRPMVVAYRLGQITYQIARFLVKTPYVSIPNLLAGRAVVPEFVQAEATTDSLVKACLAILDPRGAQQQLDACQGLREQLGGDTAARAADAIRELLQSPC